MSENQQPVRRNKRTYKRCAQSQVNENLNSQSWTTMNQWDNKRIRKPLGELSNTYMRMETENPNNHDRSLNRKLTSHSKPNGTTDLINITRRNERERNRVKLLNMGFDRLRAVVPCRSGEQLSKISTLKKAIWYIEHLDKVLHGQENSCLDLVNQSSSSSSLMCQSSEVTNEAVICSSNDTKLAKSCTLTSQPKSAGLFEINRSEARSGTSWSSFEKVMSSYGDISIQERRPVNQLYLPPIFPTRWDQNINSIDNNCSDNREIILTPKINSTPYNMNPSRHVGRIETNMLSNCSSCNFSEFRNDSGYDSPKSHMESLSEITHHNSLSRW
ncbi:achaete scute transcription factor [Schistosoma japonicum]|nr:achaete scute transcription factor [Schistosoma japonicum]